MVAITRSAHADRKKYSAKSHALMKAVDLRVAPYKGVKWPLERLEKQLDEAKVFDHRRAKYLRAARRQWLLHQRKQPCPRPRKRGYFRMMDLPAEIRNQIWEQATFVPDEDIFFNALECPRLAAVSRQVCQEVLPIFYKINDFHVLFQKASDNARYSLEIHPHTKAWQHAVLRTVYPGLGYEEFLAEVVKLRHFSFTFLDDVGSLTLPTYAEWRIDYDHTTHAFTHESSLAKRTITKLLRSSPSLRQFRFEPLWPRLQENLTALQINRNRIADFWASSQDLKKKYPTGVAAFPTLLNIAHLGPEGFHAFEQLYLTKRAQADGTFNEYERFPPGVMLSWSFKTLLGLRFR